MELTAEPSPMVNASTSRPLAQGDLRLLDDPRAVALLASPIPARMAYTAADGTPRLVPSWFHWTGTELVMATWVEGPQVRHPARRLADLRARPAVAVSIDTDDQPPQVLQIRGEAVITLVDGLVAEYVAAAHRYLGAAAAAYLEQFDPVAVRMARIAVRPAWVLLLDFEDRLPSPLGGVA